MFRSRKLFVPLAAAASAVALTLASPAFAHIEPSPTSMEAGTEGTVGFKIEHGCSGSPTTKMEIQLPDGSTGAKGVDENGFTSSVDGRVVTFEGGSVPDDQEQTFQVSFTAPPEAGEVPVKIIQTCEQGELEWIEVAEPGQPEPENPAPVLTLTEPAGGGAASSTTTEAGSTETTAAETTTTVEATTTSAAPVDEADDSDDSSSSLPWIIAAIVAIAVAAGAAVAYMAGRDKSTGDDDTDPTTGSDTTTGNGPGGDGTVGDGTTGPDGPGTPPVA